LRTLLKLTSLFFIALVVSATGLAWWVLTSQGLSHSELQEYDKARIKRDDMGVLNIAGATWPSIIQAEGFAAASERLFQMDLMRRKGDGALAEIFGKEALAFDRQQRLEDWRFYAQSAYQTMPHTQRTTCDAYARGVNEFIDQYPRNVGLEYLILGIKPTTWSCIDTLLVAMVLTDNMTRAWSRDLDMYEWHEALPEEWWKFVFPTGHPWNKLVFGNSASLPIKPPLTPLPPARPDDGDFLLNTTTDTRGLNGSNSWAYRGRHGAWLANDPHLTNSVPQLWLPIRLSTSDGWWVVGVAVPGLPGVLIGMNKDIAWSITNTGEDVDDAVFERPENIIETTKREILVKDGPSEFITIRKTPRGPIVKEISPQKLIARQWLPQKPGVLSLPAETLNRADDWTSFNQAIDEFRFVPLSFTMLDRHQNIGLRISGCDIIKFTTGAYAEDYERSEWKASCPTSTRPRIFMPRDANKPSEFLITANQRLWDDQKIHNWADDDRANRIHELLIGSDSLTVDDMRLIQLDTSTRFHRKFLRWILQNGQLSLLDSNQAKSWETWNGDIQDCPLCMSEADDLALILDQLVLRQISVNFAPTNSPLPMIKREMKRARLVSIMENPSMLKALGLQPEEVANGLMKWVSRKSMRRLKPWQDRNIWTAQHPFVGRLPFLGQLFAINEWPQFGAHSTVRAERPNHGPSMRVIWAPGDPRGSLWSFPIGTSGHATSRHYRNWSNLWQKGGMTQISVPDEQWLVP
jgi:penicillin amidase